MIYPMALRVESHPSGSLLDLILDTNKAQPDDTRVSLTRDLAIQLRHELDRHLTKAATNARP